MHKTVSIILVFLLTALFVPLQAQELNCSVKVVGDQIATIDKRVFKTLETSIFEFMNNTKWTNDNFKQDERIEVTLLINLVSVNGPDQFSGTLQIQTRRPVYKSAYNTLVLNFNDPDFNFKYVEYQPFEFNENTFTNNLTSMLAFFAYVAIGMDYDTFSPEGGTPHFQKALNVTNLAANGSDKGWKSFDSDRNRYWLIENIMNSNFKPVRACLYKYHLKGLDVMATDVQAARAAMSEALIGLEKVYSTNPNSFLMLVFFQAKADEIVNVFKPAPAEQKNKLITTLNHVNPANLQKYQKMQQ
jgi:hypothetical protein